LPAYVAELAAQDAAKGLGSPQAQNIDIFNKNVIKRVIDEL